MINKMKLIYIQVVHIYIQCVCGVYRVHIYYTYVYTIIYMYVYRVCMRCIKGVYIQGVYVVYTDCIYNNIHVYIQCIYAGVCTGGPLKQKSALVAVSGWSYFGDPSNRIDIFFPFFFVLAMKGGVGGPAQTPRWHIVVMQRGLRGC